MGAVQSVGGAATSGKGLVDHHIRAAIVAALKQSQIDTTGDDTNRRHKIHENLLSGTGKAAELFEDKDFAVETKTECVVENNGTGAPDSSAGTDMLEVVEYAPDVFHALRILGGTSNEDFSREWTAAPPRANTTADLEANKAKGEHESMQLGEGRSGALFLKSKSMAFMCKTISETEVEVLVSILKKYLAHCEQFPNSMLMRFVMMLRVTLKGEVGYILCFSDCFSNCDVLHERWDLKGRHPKPGKFRHFPGHELQRNEVQSTKSKEADNVPIQHKRTKTGAPETEEDSNKVGNMRTADSRRALKLMTFKDKNLARLFWLEPKERSELITQITNDFTFLLSCGLMDYSILIGVKYNTPEEIVEKEIKRDEIISRHQSTNQLKTTASPRNAMRNVFAMGDESTRGAIETRPGRDSSRHGSPLASASDTDPLSRTQLFLTNLNDRISKFHHGVENLECSETYYIGIIDMLTVYNGKKQTANFCKKFLWREDTLSTVPPEKYEHRIRKYAHQIFPKVDVKDDVISDSAAPTDAEKAAADDGIVGKNDGLVRVQSVRFSSTNRRTENHAPPTQSAPAPDVTSGGASSDDESEGEAFLNATTYPSDVFGGEDARTSELIAAATAGDDKTVHKLLKNQADLNEKDENGMTSLHHAASKGNQKVAKTLIDAKVDISALDLMGRSALIHASMNDCAPIAKYLISAGADLDIQDRAGCSALHHAVENYAYDVIKALIDAKANLNLAEDEGMTPLKCAMENDDDTAIDMLRAAGALEKLEDE